MALAEGVVDVGDDGEWRGPVGPVADDEADRVEDIAEHPGVRDQRDAADRLAHAVGVEERLGRLAQRPGRGHRAGGPLGDAEMIAGVEPKRRPAAGAEQAQARRQRRQLVEIDGQHEQPIREGMGPWCQPAVRDAADEQA